MTDATQTNHSITKFPQGILLALTLLSLVLAFGASLSGLILLQNKSLDVLQAHEDGFKEGTDLANMRQQTEGRLGICYFASLECPHK